MPDENSSEITVHLRFTTPDGKRPAISVAAVHDWLKRSANGAEFAKRFGAHLKIMISDGHSSEVIDFDGAQPGETTAIIDSV